MGYLEAIGTGGFLPAIWVTSVFTERFFIIFADVWVGKWSEHNLKTPVEIEAEGVGDKDRTYWLVGYVVIVSVAATFVSLTRLLSPVMTIRAARVLFRNMLVSVIRAPIYWFDFLRPICRQEPSPKKFLTL